MALPCAKERIARLEGEDGEFARIVFMNGDVLPRRALFFYPEEHQHTELPAKLGCDFTERGVVRTGEYEETSVPGLFVAGDAYAPPRPTGNRCRRRRGRSRFRHQQRPAKRRPDEIIQRIHEVYPNFGVTSVCFTIPETRRSSEWHPQAAYAFGGVIL